MPNTNWNDLTPMQLGTYAEYYAKMEFASYGFDVYTSEVDDHGVDFIAKSPNGTYYEVQAKSTRPGTDYIFVRKNTLRDGSASLNATHLLCYLRFKDGTLPDVYVIPYSVWLKSKGPNNPDCMFVDRADYESPEYGMNCSERNMPQLSDYRSEDYLRKLL